VIGYWGLQKHPFAGLDSPYVSLPSHDEAVARLVYAIEISQPRVMFIAPAGLGKSVVLRQAFRMARSPRRRLILVNCPDEEALLLALLAERLGNRLGRGPSRLTAWRALDRALRVSSLEGVQVIVAIEHAAGKTGAANDLDLDSLVHLGSTLHPRLTLIELARGAQEHRSEATDRGSLAIGLSALTRSQTEHFLTAKLTGAGAAGPIFAPRAITRLHALSAGIPRSVERLATDCLAAGALRGVDVLPPDLVDEFAGECSSVRIGAGDWC
jgi:type II secretory pathway predicted ATPase ExeA